MIEYQHLLTSLSKDTALQQMIETEFDNQGEQTHITAKP
jgi:hypothetical protein